MKMRTVVPLLILLAASPTLWASSNDNKVIESLGETVGNEDTCGDLQKAVEVMSALNATIRELEAKLVERLEELLRERLGDKPTYATIKCKPMNLRHTNKSTAAYMNKELDSIDNTALHLAASQGNIEEVKWLVESGDDINKRNKYLSTPLSLASSKGHLSVARWLIENGADVNLAENYGGTPLHFACQNGHLAVVELLIDCGAIVNRAQNDGWTPLHFACENKHLEVAEFLLSNGAYKHLKDVNGKTPYDRVPKDYSDSFKKLFAKF